MTPNQQRDMLITLAQALERYSTTRLDIIRALNRGRLTRHDSTDGVVVFDPTELDLLFENQHLADTIEQSSAADIISSQNATSESKLILPTPDELDAAVERALRAPIWPTLFPRRDQRR